MVDGAPAEGAPAPVEGAPAPEGEGAPVVETPATETETPTIVEKTPEELAAEAEAAKAEEAKFAAELPALLKRIPENELRRLGQQFANKTMAAARRAERASQDAARENATLKAKLAERDSAPSLRDDPSGALAASGFRTAKEFIEFLVAKGTGKAPDPLDEVGKLRQEIKAREAADAKRAAEAQNEADRAAVAGAIKADPARWARTATGTGQSRLWGEIVEYAKVHGNCPDSAVFYLADQVERELRTEFGEPAPRTAATSSTASANGAAGARTGAKATTLTSKGSGGAPVVREYSKDPDERREQIRKELLAEGILKQTAS